MRRLRLFSAASTLDPVAVAPDTEETVAVYSPSDSSTLPEYCLPATVVEKLVAASISSVALLLLAPPPPPDEKEPERDVWLADAVVAEDVLEDVWVEAEDAVEADDEVVFAWLTATGFNTWVVETLDGIEPTNMIFSLY